MPSGIEHRAAAKVPLHGGATVVPYRHRLTSSDAQVRQAHQRTDLHYSTARVQCSLPPCPQLRRLRQESRGSKTCIPSSLIKLQYILQSSSTYCSTVVLTVLRTRPANVPDGVAYSSKSLGLQLLRMDSCSTVLHSSVLYRTTNTLCS